MQSTIVYGKDVMDDFLTESIGTQPQTQTASPAPAPAAPNNTTATPTNEQQPSTGGAVPGPGEELENELLAESGKAVVPGQEAGGNAAPTEFFSDFTDLGKDLVEKKLLYPFGTPEDPRLPTTKEEFYENLQLSIQHNAAAQAQEQFDKIYEEMPPSLQKLHEFAARGVTTATDFERYTQALAQKENVDALDVKNPDHQREIVYMQMKNLSGLDDASIRAEIEDLTASKKLEAAAERYLPGLKKIHSDAILKEENDAKLKEERFQSDIKNNSIYANYFLNNDKENVNQELPFEIAKDDHGYKRQIYTLASKVTSIDTDGNPVYQWQDEINALQYGTKEQFREFMAVMAFLADRKKYNESTAAKGATTEKKNNFMQIITNGATPVNHERSTAVPAPGPKNPAPASKSRWGR